MKKLVVALIHTYKLILGGRQGLLTMTVGGCGKHSPTCSEYTVRQVREVGVVRGIYKGLRRFLSCF